MKDVYDWIKEHATVIGTVIAFLALFFSLIIIIIPICTWYKDSDGDGYGNPSQNIWRLWQSDGYVGNSDDCYDGNKEAYPGQSNFFEKDRGDGSFDYDCNGVAEREFTDTGECTSDSIITDPVAKQGWDDYIPDPGEKGDWLKDCDRKVVVKTISIPVPFTGKKIKIEAKPDIIVVKETVSKIQKGR